MLIIHFGKTSELYANWLIRRTLKNKMGCVDKYRLLPTAYTRICHLLACTFKIGIVFKMKLQNVSVKMPSYFSISHL